jgi:hypothetical protein
MKKIFVLLSASTLFASCATNSIEDFTPPLPPADEMETGYWTGPEFISAYKSSPNAIYSLRNVQEALDLLAAEGTTRAEAITLEPTHHYVRFLPQNERDIYILHDSLNLDIFHFPFDHELTPEELDLHLDEEKINGYGWQYCLVESDFQMPTEMKWELLDYAYLQPDDEETLTRSGKSYQLPADVYSAAIDKSVEITSTEGDTPQTRASVWQPSGSIKYMSGLPNEPNAVPLEGVYVRANTDLNTGSAYTTSDGTFTIARGAGGRFRNKVHYMVIWYRDDKWKIHDGAGKADTKRSGDAWIKEAWNPVFGNDEFGFCAAIHRALYEYFYGTSPSVANLLKIDGINVLERWGESRGGTYPEPLSHSALGSRDEIEIYGKYRKKDSNGNVMGGDLVIPTNDEVLAQMFYNLGGVTYHKKSPGNSREEKLSIAWCAGVEHAYMTNYYPSYVRAYFSTRLPAVAVSLLRNGVTIAEIQRVMIQDAPSTLEQCRQLFKSYHLVIPDSTIDLIFDNPSILY